MQQNPTWYKETAHCIEANLYQLKSGAETPLILEQIMAHIQTLVEHQLNKQVEEKPSTWTITAQFTVFAGDMDKASVIGNAESLLTNMTDGSDLIFATVIDAKRDEI